MSSFFYSSMKMDHFCTGANEIANLELGSLGEYTRKRLTVCQQNPNGVDPSNLLGSINITIPFSIRMCGAIEPIVLSRGSVSAFKSTPTNVTVTESIITISANCKDQDQAMIVHVAFKLSVLPFTYRSRSSRL